VEQTPTLALVACGFVADVKGRETTLYQWASAGAKSASVWGLDPVTGAVASERLTAPGLVRDYVAAGDAAARTAARLHLEAVAGQVAAGRDCADLPEVAALRALLAAVQDEPMGAAAIALLE
jgi:hypothetical protein